MSQYDDIAGPGGKEILRQLYSAEIPLADCPMAADVVDDYLNTGNIVPAPPAIGISLFNITANWRLIRRQALIDYVRSLGANHHVVVKGIRSPASLQRFLDENPPRRLTITHYFIVANIGNRVYVIDAMGKVIDANVSGYITGQGFDGLAYTRSFAASEIVRH
ncbi:MAG: hypothetical protein WA584_08790 [Pyrinomonadaceae bacterium]